MKKSFLLKPIISEKTISEAKFNKYYFGVSLLSRKEDIKKIIESLFKVNVIKLNTLKNAGEIKRDFKHNKKIIKRDQKKVVVTLKKGQKIDLFEISESKN
ncbi:50S ribosomal protein L23 [Patescibacteria group bacterium]|nr:50S ribosomal protein L23 [Patescibacteria group bacterium]